MSHRPSFRIPDHMSLHLVILARPSARSVKPRDAADNAARLLPMAAQGIGFHPDGTVDVDTVGSPQHVAAELPSQVLPFFTGTTRTAFLLVHSPMENCAIIREAIADLRPIPTAFERSGS